METQHGGIRDGRGAGKDGRVTPHTYSQGNQSCYILNMVIISSNQYDFDITVANTKFGFI